MGRHKYTVQILQHFTYGKFEGIYFKYFNFNTFLDNFFSFTIDLHVSMFYFENILTQIFVISLNRFAMWTKGQSKICF